MRLICIIFLVAISASALADGAVDEESRHGKPPLRQAAIAAREKIREHLQNLPESSEESSDEEYLMDEEEEEDDSSTDESEENISDNLVKRSLHSPPPRPPKYQTPLQPSPPNPGYIPRPRPDLRPGGYVRPVTIPARVTLRPRPGPGYNARRGQYNGGRNEVDPIIY